MIPFVGEIVRSPVVPHRIERYYWVTVDTPRRVPLSVVNWLTPEFNAFRPFVLAAQVIFTSSVTMMYRVSNLYAQLLREDCAHGGYRVRNKKPSFHWPPLEITTDV